MAERNTEEELSTGEVASYRISPMQPDKPKLVKNEEPEKENNHDDK